MARSAAGSSPTLTRHGADKGCFRCASVAVCIRGFWQGNANGTTDTDHSGRTVTLVSRLKRRQQDLRGLATR